MEKLSINELHKTIRAATALYVAINKHGMSLIRAAEIIRFGGHKEALELGLTVTSQGIYHDYDFDCNPIREVLGRCIRKRKNSTLLCLDGVRERAKSLIENY